MKDGTSRHSHPLSLVVTVRRNYTSNRLIGYFRRRKGGRKEKEEKEGERKGKKQRKEVKKEGKESEKEGLIPGDLVHDLYGISFYVGDIL